MEKLLFQTYGSYHIGSFHEVNKKLLEAWIKCFSVKQIPSRTGLGGRTRMGAIQVPDHGSFFIKSYFRGGMIRYLVKNKYIKSGKPRSQVEFEMMKKVQELGINVPEPIAFAYQGKLFYQCWLITREMTNHQTLVDLSTKNLNDMKKIMLVVVNQVAKLIKNRILHVDFHPGNVIIANKKVYFIDFDKARYCSGDEKKLTNRYLKRWNRAVLKYDLPSALTGLFQSGLQKKFAAELDDKNEYQSG